MPAKPTKPTTTKRTRRSAGDGAVYADTARPGTYVGQVWLHGRRRKVRGKTKTEVLTKLSALKREAAAGVVVDGNARFGQLASAWHERTLGNRELSPSSMDNYEWALRVLGHEFGTVRLRQLDIERIEQGLDHIATGMGEGSRGKPVSRRTLKLMRSTLAQVLDLGVRRKLLPANPARQAELTPTAARTVTRRALTPAEAGVLWENLEGERLGNLWKLMLTTGLRPGEALGLCWDAVDLDAGVLVVRRAVRREHGRAVLVDELKTASSSRTIALPAPAIDVLRAQRKNVAEMKLAAAVWATVDHELVFPTDRGTPWDPSNARDELTAVCERARIWRVRPHELRHSCASILSDRGVPLELIADLLGHKDSTMLARTYRHALRPSADAAVEVMGGLFGSARP
jgi:integrase